MEMNSLTSIATRVAALNSGTSERRTRVMKEHDRVSRMRSACVQKRMIGFNTSGVWRINNLVSTVASKAPPVPIEQINLHTQKLLDSVLMTHRVFAGLKVQLSTSPK